MLYVKTYENYNSMDIINEFLDIKFDLIGIKDNEAKIDIGSETCLLSIEIITYK